MCTFKMYRYVARPKIKYGALKHSRQYNKNTENMSGFMNDCIQEHGIKTQRVVS